MHFDRSRILFFIVICLFVSCQKQAAEKDDAQTETKEFSPEQIAFSGETLFEQRFACAEFSPDLQWFNKDQKISKTDFQGLFVFVVFWHFTDDVSIELIHHVQQLQEEYPDSLAVIGVHCPKYAYEKESQHLLDAIRRHEIRIPVVNDRDRSISERWAILKMPGLALIDPEWNGVWATMERPAIAMARPHLENAIQYYDGKNLLKRRKLNLYSNSAGIERVLNFPRRVLADEDSNRLFISDTENHRIVVTDLAGVLIDVIGRGRKGNNDGAYQDCSFNQPHGLELQGKFLYVADSCNHLIRRVDLETKQVSTIAGTGMQRFAPYLEQKGFDRWKGDPRKTDLNFPRDIISYSSRLYISMSGNHQVWQLESDLSQIGPFAGNGLFDLSDGDALPGKPLDPTSASFARPLGMTRGFEMIYLADGQANSVRQFSPHPGTKVDTLIGSIELPVGRLMDFGDRNGGRGDATLHHPSDIAFHIDSLFVADSFNHKIKIIQSLGDDLVLETAELIDFLGTGQPGDNNAKGQVTFNNPCGISIANDKIYVADTGNHQIRVIGIYSRKVTTLEIEGLKIPQH